MPSDAIQLAFVTYSGEPEIAVDDLPLAHELERRGVVVSACPWDLRELRPGPVRNLLIRSAWNYDSAPEAFLQWLIDLEEKGARVVNSSEIVRWNIHKNYLLEAADRGATLPRTRKFVPANADPEALAAEFAGHDRVVLKPCVSLSAHHTYLIRTGEIFSAVRDLANPEREYLLQEYMPEIEAGELSFVYFAAQFSHCVRKTPKQGDFRVQGDFGATRVIHVPTAEQIKEASKLLSLAPEVPVYARVDVVMRGSTLVLMEIELIDPMLFLGWEPQAAARMADVLLRWFQ
jgi:glutathione synthase/RimK-type ligase-like ATP-grasp enzyme